MLIQNYIGLNKVLSQTCFIIYDCSFNWKTAIWLQPSTKTKWRRPEQVYFG